MKIKSASILCKKLPNSIWRASKNKELIGSTFKLEEKTVSIDNVVIKSIKNEIINDFIDILLKSSGFFSIGFKKYIYTNV